MRVQLLCCALFVSACGVTVEEEQSLSTQRAAVEAPVNRAAIQTRSVDGYTFDDAVADLDRNAVFTTDFDENDPRVTARITNKCSFFYEVCLWLGNSKTTCRWQRADCIQREIAAHFGR